MDSGGLRIQDAGFDPEYQNLIVLYEGGSAVKARVYLDEKDLVNHCTEMLNK